MHNNSLRIFLPPRHKDTKITIFHLKEEVFLSQYQNKDRCKVPSQDILNKMVSVARSVNGAAAVDTSQVTIG